jgi:hypothetical protein
MKCWILGKVDQQTESSHICFKRNFSQGPSFNARFEDLDAAFKARMQNGTEGWSICSQWSEFQIHMFIYIYIYNKWVE